MKFVCVYAANAASGFKRTLTFCFFLLTAFTGAYSQVGTINLMNAPQSPQAIGLGKFVEMPVNLHTGQAGVSVPLYNLEVKGLNIPISLSCNTSGIKVKDIAGPVGLGWSLNAGGVITRVVMGNPDDHEYINGNLQHNDAYFAETRLKIKNAYGSDLLNIGAFSEEDRYRIALSTPGVATEPSNDGLYELFTQKTDTEVDTYYFNFLGYNGQFTFTNEGEPFLLSGPEGMKIEYLNRRYKITDPAGVVYSFNAVEKALDAERNGGTLYVTSWYLTEIYMPVQQQTVKFAYTDYTIGVESIGVPYMKAFSSIIHRLVYLSLQATEASSPGVVPRDPGCSPYNGYSTGPGLAATMQHRNTLMLKEIEWDDTRITFFGSLGRQDLYKYKLDSFKVTVTGDLRHEVKFAYGYFNNSDPDVTNRKLKLMAVTANDQQYAFAYNESLYGRQVPGVFAKGQDIWGYYNGEDDESALPYYRVIKNVLDQEPGTSYYLPDYSSTPKNPDENFARLGALASITYPTGGKTVFEYEGNDFTRVGFAGGQMATGAETQMTHMQLQNMRDKSIRVDADVQNTPETMNSEREFIVHEQQQKTISVALGYNFQRYQTLPYQTYMDAVYNRHGFASVVLQRYNNATGLFDDLMNYQVVPAERIGEVTSQQEFQNKRTLGWLNASQTILLTEGRYRVAVAAEGWYLMAAISGLDISFPYKKAPSVYKGAGIRIKKTSFYSTGGTTPELVKNYVYTGQDGLSSGVLESPFGNVSTSCYLTAQHAGPWYSYQQACYFANMTSEASIPLGNSQGGVIGYASVTELLNDNSKTEYIYTTSLNGPEYSDGYIIEETSVPQALIRVKEDNSWKRGLLKKTAYYKSNGDRVQETFNDYFFENGGEKYTASLVLTNLRFNLSPFTVGNYFNGFTTTTNYYYRYKRHVLKTLDSVINYSNTGNLTDVTRYEYNAFATPHVFPVTTRHLTAQGQTVTRTRYPQDYNVGNNPVQKTAKGIKNLVNKNLVAQPVETWVQKEVTGSSEVKTVAGVFNQFKETVALPDTIFVLRIQAGLQNYQPVAVSAGAATFNSAYKPDIHFLKYDAWGNINEQAKVDNVKDVIIWGYHNRYPVARITGGDYTTIMNLLNQQVLNEPASEAQLLTELNKIRTAYAGTNIPVTTYAYIPLKGISAEVNAAGRKTSYEYDRQGRLVLVRDQNGNIIKKICYNYQGQPVNCGN